MGYRSDVTVTLTGNEQECKDLLNAYRLTETKEQMAESWHLLSDSNEDEQVKFFYEEIESNDPVVQLTWLFSAVKWYAESEEALSRLGEILEEMQEDDKNQSLAILFNRIGENADDYEETHWGESPFDYENPVDLCRYFDIQAPAVEANPIELLFKNNEGK